MARSVAYDCTTCGACCASPDANRAAGYADWVELQPGEPLLSASRLVRRFVVRNPAGESHMRMDAVFRCAALRGTIGRSVACVVYDQRPTPCRNMEPGSERCLALRRERGVGT